MDGEGERKRMMPGIRHGGSDGLCESSRATSAHNPGGESGPGLWTAGVSGQGCQTIAAVPSSSGSSLAAAPEAVATSARLARIAPAAVIHRMSFLPGSVAARAPLARAGSADRAWLIRSLVAWARVLTTLVGRGPAEDAGGSAVHAAASSAAVRETSAPSGRHTAARALPWSMVDVILSPSLCD
jgi:hypothetical protein